MKWNKVSREEGAKAQEALKSLSVASPQARSQHLWALSMEEQVPTLLRHPGL